MHKMKSSEALKLARVRIEKEENAFLCVALKDVQGRNTLVYKRVSSCLQGIGVIGWLRREHPDIAKQIFLTEEGYKAYRLAWIDWMIPQYELS